MFEPVSESKAKSYHDEIAYQMTLSHRGIAEQHLALHKIREVKENLYDIYAMSLANLSEAIGRLNPGVSTPQWHVTGRASLDSVALECRIDDASTIFLFSSYERYLKCVDQIKEKYNFDELLKAYEEKEQQWGDRLKERLCSYRKLSAFN